MSMRSVIWKLEDEQSGWRLLMLMAMCPAIIGVSITDFAGSFICMLMLALCLYVTGKIMHAPASDGLLLRIADNEEIPRSLKVEIATEIDLSGDISLLHLLILAERHDQRERERLCQTAAVTDGRDKLMAIRQATYERETNHSIVGLSQ